MELDHAYAPQDDDQAAHHADMLAYERDAMRIIEKAQYAPITPDEAALLRWACGILH